MSNMICTDPDAYQWQRLEKYGENSYGYAMCQVISFDNDHYAVLHGTIDLDCGYRDDPSEVKEIADFFGYEPDELLGNDALFAECIFEYYMEEFVENPYGLSPVYLTPEAACKRCDELMDESHEDMWLTRDV